jgi:hypothetical protein
MVKMQGKHMAKSFLEEHRWDLCKSFLERADKSADISRVLLFTASGAGVAFAIQQIEGDERGHLIAASFFAVAIFMLYLSWDRQKVKARKRFTLLRDEGVNAYLENEKETRSNRGLDWIAFILLAIGAFIEAGLAYVVVD